LKSPQWPRPHPKPRTIPSSSWGKPSLEGSFMARHARSVCQHLENILAQASIGAGVATELPRLRETAEWATTFARETSTIPVHTAYGKHH
jgi:hypothetical protein